VTIVWRLAAHYGLPVRHRMIGMRPTVLILFVCAVLACGQQKKELPEPRVVTPGAQPGEAPSDAIVLVGAGVGVDGWTKPDGSPTGCHAANSEMICATGAKDAVSKIKYRAAQIHLEFSQPLMVDEKGQMRGNSGVYLQGRYEVQILDSFQNPTYADGALGAVYGESAPLVNPARKPPAWQTYDIVFHPHQCSADGKVTENGSVTVILNGVLVQDHHRIQSTKGGCSEGPLLLQDHSGFPGAPLTELKFRNVWIRKLE
jgi:hypothetical protein